MDKNLIDKDIHFKNGCASCHRGDEKAHTRDGAHKNLLKRPSENLEVCGKCHGDVTNKYKIALHFTSEGQRNGVAARFSKKELKAFDEKVFGRSCRSCHASCGDCHVRTPAAGGISAGLIKSHRFIKKDEGKTCAPCHGGRVYPEFTGEYGGVVDVHYQRGILCLDCHKAGEFHGDGTTYASKRDVREKPACVNCHKPGKEKTEKALAAHRLHDGKLSCYSCHSGGSYRNCYGCHLEKGATSKPGFILGISPGDKKTFTTLRLIPTARDTFKALGIGMEMFDNVPNYRDTAPHNIRKRTERTRSCEVCHDERKDFLTKRDLIKNGPKANEGLVYTYALIDAVDEAAKPKADEGLICTEAARPIDPAVSTDWLEKNLENPRVVIVDIRKVEEYRAGHIPNAVNVFYKSWAMTKGGLRNKLPPVDDLFDVIEYAGINADSITVLVGKTDGIPDRTDISHVAWALKYACIEGVAILDGGHNKWAGEKKPLSTETVRLKGKACGRKVNEALFVKKDYVMANIGKAVIVDTREPDFHRGLTKMEFVEKKGRIKGAVNLPTSKAYAKDGTFRTREELKSITSAVVGKDKEKEIILYCDTGKVCTAWSFIMTELLSYRNVKVYSGSAEEWMRDPQAPIEK